MAFQICMVAAIAGSLQGCLEFGDTYSAVPPGIWRGELSLSSSPQDIADEHTGAVLPFNFEVVYTTPDSFYIVLVNGSERIVNTHVSWGHDIQNGDDTLRIDFPVYGTYIQARFEEDAIEGTWNVPFRGEYVIPFKARHGKQERFSGVHEPPAMDLSGRWRVSFGIETDSPHFSVGEFQQDGNEITGTFLSQTGDDRYLEGVVDGNRMYLSTFDGTHAYLYEAKLLEDGTLTGIYRSGKHYKTYWSALPDPDYKLPSADSLVSVIREADPVHFSLPDTEGNMVSPDDTAFEGRPMLIQIMGTWCPNCRDETEFLKEYFSNAKGELPSILAIAFERRSGFEEALPSLLAFQDNFNIEYPVLFGGSLDKSEASAIFPQLDTVMAFPTLLFLDRNKQIVQVHTGFSGPATSEYTEFKTNFDQKVRALIQQE